MSWGYLRNAYVPLLPAVLYFISPELLVEKRANADAPVVALRPGAIVSVENSAIADTKTVIVAQAESKPADAKPPEGKAEEKKDAKAGDDKSKGDDKGAKDKGDRKRPNLEEAFKKMDANGDGSISKDEFKAAMSTFHEGMAERRKHRGHGARKGVGAHGRRGMHGGFGRHRGFGMSGRSGHGDWGRRFGMGGGWGRGSGIRGGFGRGFGMHGGGRQFAFRDFRPGAHRGPGGHMGPGGPGGGRGHAFRDRGRRGLGRDGGPRDERRGREDGRIEKLEKQIQELQKTVEQLSKAQKA